MVTFEFSPFLNYIHKNKSLNEHINCIVYYLYAIFKRYNVCVGQRYKSPFNVWDLIFQRDMGRVSICDMWNELNVHTGLERKEEKKNELHLHLNFINFFSLSEFSVVICFYYYYYFWLFNEHNWACALLFFLCLHIYNCWVYYMCVCVVHLVSLILRLCMYICPCMCGTFFDIVICPIWFPECFAL